MRFIRYTPFFAAGTVFGGLVSNFLSEHQFLVSAAKPVKVEIDAIISKSVEEYVNQYSLMMKYGFPSYDTLRLKRGYVLSYDRRTKVPNWVMEHLTSVTNDEEACKKRRKFLEDDTIHEYFRATKNDYRHSGYDKGHLANAANHKYSQPAYDETYVLSNAAPQDGHFNKGIWNLLETRVRNLVEKHGSVYVCSGPLYLPRKISLKKEEALDEILKRKRSDQTQNSSQAEEKKYMIYEVIGENNVAVPTHFFKIIVCEVGIDKYDMEVYMIPNEVVDPKQGLSKFMVPRDAVERAAGFLLFEQIPPSTFRFINEKVPEN